nr:MAG TPA: hypothetical protein [Caudoviricetes sp.]
MNFYFLFHNISLHLLRNIYKLLFFIISSSSIYQCPIK